MVNFITIHCLVCWVLKTWICFFLLLEKIDYFKTLSLSNNILANIDLFFFYHFKPFFKNCSLEIALKKSQNSTCLLVQYPHFYYNTYISNPVASICINITVERMLMDNSYLTVSYSFYFKRTTFSPTA